MSGCKESAHGYLYDQHGDTSFKFSAPKESVDNPYYYSYDPVDYTVDGIPVTYIKKKRGCLIEEINKEHNFGKVSNCFEISEGVAFQLDEARTGLSIFEGQKQDVESFRTIIGSCDYKARSGVEFTPYEVYTLEAVEGDYEPGEYRFKNYSSALSIHKAVTASKKGIRLGTAYIKPLVKGPSIDRFKVNFQNEYGIFPYNEGETMSIPLTQLAEKNERLLHHLIHNKGVILNQSKRSRMIARGQEFYSLSKVGPYTFGANLVAFRDNSKMAAAVVEPVKTHWGEKVLPVCAKHAPYISMDKNGHFISNDEAHYICAILNTKIVRDYFKFTYSSRSFSINFNIKIPKFDKYNTAHVKLSDLSKIAHRTNSMFDKKKLERQMNDIYLNMCNATDDD